MSDEKEKKEIAEEVTEEVTEPLEDSESSSQEEKPNYEAIAREERERTADPLRAKIAIKEREAKREIKEEEPEAEKPLTRSELLAVLAEREKSTDKDKTSEIARTLAESDAEADAILAVYENRTFPANLSLKEKLEEAQAIVNRKRTIAKTQEVARALKSKEAVNGNPAGTHRDAPAGTEPKISASDRKGLIDAGYVWDGTKQVFKKKLGGGKFLYMKSLKDPTWIE